MMKAYLCETPVGFVLFDERGEIMETELYELDPIKYSYVLSKINKNEDTEQIDELATKINKFGLNEIVLENADFREILQDKIDPDLLIASNFAIFKKFRENLPDLMIERNPKITEDLIINKLNIVAERITREKIREESQQSDVHIMHIVEAYEDTLKFINVYSLRLREWYGVHFPELSDTLISDIKQYATIVSDFGNRTNINKEGLMEKLNYGDNKANQIVERTKTSMGADFTELQMSLVKDLSDKVLELLEFRDKLEDDLETILKEVAPNMLTLVGAQLAGKLIQLAGGLKELSRMPSSTIQVLGAEKALFRALRKNADSPKHGIIYTWPPIRTAPIWQRGKISRLLAGKLSICSKVDYFEGDFVGDKILAEVEEKIEEIKETFADPPKRKSRKKRKSRRHSRSSKKYRRR